VPNQIITPEIMPKLTVRNARKAPSAVITGIAPVVDAGCHPVKRVEGEPLRVEADVFKDGHDQIAVCLHWRRCGEHSWQEVAMVPCGNDRWQAEVVFDEVGRYELTLSAWPDAMATWIDGFQHKLEAGEKDLHLEILEAGILVEGAARRARRSGEPEVARELVSVARLLPELDAESVAEVLFAPEVASILRMWPDRDLETVVEPYLPVVVEPLVARFSAWYEFFPRNAHADGRTHGRFRDCVPMLDHAKNMGFDVVYFPPIHPIGNTHRKGKNNQSVHEPGDVGSPWAIGNEQGGHLAVEPELGTVEDFEWLVGQARERGLQVALDFALNCSPDHPYVRDHPDWFHVRPDGSIKYAENPPKKYQDIYPLNFHCDDWRTLWDEVRDIFLFWIERGVSIFRVDNPHTKPLAMWEDVLAQVKSHHPQAIFLSEAFTRPKMMKELAKIGFSQSYTYFTWRTTKDELTEYVTELSAGPERDYFRPNFWPTTPDILPYELWNAPPEKFCARALLAATLVCNWGMYSGYEWCENTPLPPKEEYLDSEKYQLVRRDLGDPGICDFIGRLNRARQLHPALQNPGGIEFITSENSEVIAYARRSEDGQSRMLVVVNLDARNRQESNIHVPLEYFGLDGDSPYQLLDILDGESYDWQGEVNYVALDPTQRVGHLFEIRQPL